MKLCQFKLNIPIELHIRLKNAGHINQRSANKEAVHRLIVSFGKPRVRVPMGRRELQCYTLTKEII